MKKEDILYSTNIDGHGHKPTKECLEDIAKKINSNNRKVQLTLEHDKTFPPLGIIKSARILQGEDDEYYLVGIKEYFDQREELYLSNGTKLIKEFSKDDQSPFAGFKLEPCENIEIYIDPINFTDQREVKQFFNELKNETHVDFKPKALIRKALIPEPEIIITLSKFYCAYLLYKISGKVGDKLSDEISDDLVKLYSLIKEAAKNIIKYVRPEDGPITYVIELPEEDINIQFVAKTNNSDNLVNALMEDTLFETIEKINKFKSEFGAEKIQFTLGPDNKWELNYMLTSNGEVIGTEKSFEKRNRKKLELIR